MRSLVKVVCIPVRFQQVAGLVSYELAKFFHQISIGAWKKFSLCFGGMWIAWCKCLWRNRCMCLWSRLLLGRTENVGLLQTCHPTIKPGGIETP